MVSLRSPSVVPTKTYGLRGRIDVDPAFRVNQISRSGPDMAEIAESFGWEASQQSLISTCFRFRSMFQGEARNYVHASILWDLSNSGWCNV